MSDPLLAPAVAVALTTLFTAPEDREFVLGDLEESYRGAADRHGPRAAGSACVVDVLASVPSLLVLRVARLFRRDPRGSFMSRLSTYLLPPAGRHFAYWLTFCISVYALSGFAWLWWPAVVEAIVPQTTYDVALSMPWALGMFAIEMALVALAIGVARANSGPRWLWLPLAVFAGVGTLFNLASAVQGFLQQNVLPAGDGVFNVPLSTGEIVYRFTASFTPIVTLAVPALLVCLWIGDRREPLFGPRADLKRFLVGSALAALGSLSMVTLTSLGAFFMDSPVIREFDVLGFAVTPALVIILVIAGAGTLLATRFAGLPRAAWLAVAVPGVLYALAGSLLTPLGPTTELLVDTLVPAALVAAAALGGAVIGSALAERGPRADVASDAC